ILRSELMSPYRCPSTNTNANPLPAGLNDVAPCAASQFGRRRDNASYTVATSALAPTISSAVRKSAFRGAAAAPDVPDVHLAGAQAIMAATATRKRCLTDIAVLPVLSAPLAALPRNGRGRRSLPGSRHCSSSSAL